MKRFLLYLCIVVLGSAVLDGLYRLLCYGVFEHPAPDSVIAMVNKYAANDTPAEIAVLGASRAFYHYDIRQIEDSLRMSAYNWGYDGQSVINQYVCLLKAIKNGQLQIAILDLSDLQLGKWIESRISALYPYYWSCDTIKRIVKEVGGTNMGVLMSSSFIQYNSSIYNIIVSSSKKEANYKGFSSLPYTGKAVQADSSQTEIVPEYNKFGIIYFKRISEICRKNDVRLIVCVSPFLGNYNTEAMKDLCNSQQIEFWDMTNSISDPLLFSDPSHLNEKGAAFFTNLIINRIKSL